MTSLSAALNAERRAPRPSAPRRAPRPTHCPGSAHQQSRAVASSRGRHSIAAVDNSPERRAHSAIRLQPAVAPRQVGARASVGSASSGNARIASANRHQLGRCSERELHWELGLWPRRSRWLALAQPFGLRPASGRLPPCAGSTSSIGPRLDRSFAIALTQRRTAGARRHLIARINILHGKARTITHHVYGFTARMGASHCSICAACRRSAAMETSTSRVRRTRAGRRGWAVAVNHACQEERHQLRAWDDVRGSGDRAAGAPESPTAPIVQAQDTRD